MSFDYAPGGERGYCLSMIVLDLALRAFAEPTEFYASGYARANGPSDVIALERHM